MNGKKILKIAIPVVLIILIALAVLFAVKSCGKPKTETEPAKNADHAQEDRTAADANTAGQYEITAMVTKGKETTAEDLALLKSKGLNCTITLNPDGTGILNLFGEETDITWNATTISTGEKTMKYAIQEDQLTLADGDSSLTFLRIG